MIKYTYSVYVGDDQNNLCITVPFFLSWLEELGHNFISTKLREWIVCVLVAQSCPTLCDPMDCSPRGSSVHGIFLARILEQVVISSSKRSSPSRDRTCVSRISCTATDSLLLSRRGSPITTYTDAQIIIDMRWGESIQHLGEDRTLTVTPKNNKNKECTENRDIMI